MRSILRTVLPVALLLATASAFASGAGWLTSYSAAVKESKKTGKPILADFTGSDWCTFCNLLRKQVFETKEFKDWAKKNVVLLTLDFPQKKKLPPALLKQNKALEAKYKPVDWPTVLFVDASGKELGRTGYIKGGPGPWLAKAKSILGK